VTVYALRLENNTDTAPRMRMGDALAMPAGPSLLSTRQGFRPEPGVAAVTAVAGTMQVRVAPFMAWVDGGVSTVQGGYPVINDATETLTLAAGDASLARTDVIAVVVRDDPFDGSGQIKAEVRVVQGSPGGGVPVLPTNSLTVAHVAVPAGLSAGTGGLASGHITDKRTYIGAGGIIPVLSQAERDALPATTGAAVFRMESSTREVREPSGWQPYQKLVSSEAAVSFTGGVVSSGEGTKVYRRGGVGFLEVEMQFTAAWSSGTVLVVPTGYRPPRRVWFQTVAAGVSYLWVLLSDGVLQYGGGGSVPAVQSHLGYVAYPLS